MNQIQICCCNIKYAHHKPWTVLDTSAMAVFSQELVIVSPWWDPDPILFMVCVMHTLIYNSRSRLAEKASSECICIVTCIKVVFQTPRKPIHSLMLNVCDKTGRSTSHWNVPPLTSIKTTCEKVHTHGWVITPHCNVFTILLWPYKQCNQQKIACFIQKQNTSYLLTSVTRRRVQYLPEEIPQV